MNKDFAEDRHFQGSVFKAASDVIAHLKREEYSIETLPVGNIGEIMEGHPHEGYGNRYVYKIPAQTVIFNNAFMPSNDKQENVGFAIETKGLIIGMIRHALHHLSAKEVPGLETLDVRGNGENITFSDVDYERFRNFIENPPVALYESLELVKAYYLDDRFWSKRTDGALERIIEFDEGGVMYHLLKIHNIDANEIDDAAYLDGADTAFRFVISPESLRQMQMNEEYKNIRAK